MTELSRFRGFDPERDENLEAEPDSRPEADELPFKEPDLGFEAVDNSHTYSDFPQSPVEDDRISGLF